MAVGVHTGLLVAVGVLTSFLVAEGIRSTSLVTVVMPTSSHFAALVPPGFFVTGGVLLNGLLVAVVFRTKFCLAVGIRTSFLVAVGAPNISLAATGFRSSFRGVGIGSIFYLASRLLACILVAGDSPTRLQMSCAASSCQYVFGTARTWLKVSLVGVYIQISSHCAARILASFPAAVSVQTNFRVSIDVGTGLLAAE